MFPRKMVATLLLLAMVAMLAEQSEGFIAFFTHKDFEHQLKSEGQNKFLTAQKRSDARAFPELSEDDGQIIKLVAPVEIGIHLNSRQLEKYQDILEELLTETLPDTQKVN